MPTAENKALMQRIFARLAEGDGSLFVAHLHETATMTGMFAGSPPAPRGPSRQGFWQTRIGSWSRPGAR